MKTNYSTDKTRNSGLDSKLGIFLFIIAFLLSGADLLSLNVFGGNVRAVFLIVPLLMLFVLMSKLQIYFLGTSIYILLYLLLLFSFISILSSYNHILSLMYWIWLGLTIFLLFLMSYLGIKLDKHQLIEGVMKSGIIVAIITILLFILGNISQSDIFEILGSSHVNIYRPSFWFYEPSYLATFLIFPFTLIFFLVSFGERVKRGLVIVLIFLISLFSTTSSAGYLGIIMVFSLVHFWKMYLRVPNKVTKNLYYLITVFSFIFIGFLLYGDVFEVFLYRMFSDFEGASGSRISSYNIAFKTFIESWLLGVGIGGYEDYVGQPPFNVLLEILATLGVLGGVWLIIFFVYLPFKGLHKSIKNGKINDIYLFSVSNAIIVTMMVLQANQNYLRPYIWLDYAILIVFLYKNRVNRRKSKSSLVKIKVGD
jgi:O-antigen ligase